MVFVYACKINMKGIIPSVTVVFYFQYKHIYMAYQYFLYAYFNHFANCLATNSRELGSQYNIVIKLDTSN